MNLFISTSLSEKIEAENVFRLLEKWSGINLGVEVFPMFHQSGYSDVLDGCMERLEDVPVSFHEQYYDTEHSAGAGSDEYVRAMEYSEAAFAYAARLGASHVVFHYNNCPVTEETKADIIRVSSENLADLTWLADLAGLELVVENVGVASLGNVLFGEDEFIDLFGTIPNKCLFDVGHAHCNRWNFKRALRSLGDKIVCYHLHNNYGIADEHNSIMDGTLDMEMFFGLYRRYTPDADIVLEYRGELLGNPELVESDITFVLELASRGKNARTPSVKRLTGSPGNDLSRRVLWLQFLSDGIFSVWGFGV